MTKPLQHETKAGEPVLGKSSRPMRITGIGEFLWDLLPFGKQMGGAPANFAYHARILGAESTIISAVGDDVSGRDLANQLVRIGLNRDFVVSDSEHPTGTVTVALDPKGVPDFTIHEKVAWDFIPWTSELKTLAARSDAVCFGTLAQRAETSRTTIRTFLRSTSPDCLRIFDVNLRQMFYSKDVLLGSLEMSDILKLNETELPVVARLLSLTGSETEILTTLLERFGLEFIALTQGERGSRLLSPKEDSRMDAPAVRVVDTVGAGDAFTAVLAVGVLSEWPIRQIHRMATDLAAYVCTQKGATPDIPQSMIDTWFHTQE